MFMTPGLALFYGGMVRAKNVLAMLMQNFICLGLIGVLWAVCMYSLAFSGTGKWIGNFDLAFLDGANLIPATGFGAVPIPPLSFSAFQMMFAIITPALITGASPTACKFSAWLWFIGLWALLVYTPVAHWVFSPAGWLFRRGALDFAGGTVVHINAGIAALVAVLVIGRRRGWPQHPSPPHSLPLTLLGTGILWFGWFGFNAGSALGGQRHRRAGVHEHDPRGLGRHARLAVVRAHPGRARDHAGRGVGCRRRPRGHHAVRRLRRAHGRHRHRLRRRRVCYFAVSVKFRFGYDDALDVVGVHLVGGLIGSLLLGLFADRAFNPAVVHEGVFIDGSWELMGDQLIAVGATLLWSGVLTFVILKVLHLVMPGGLRVSDEDEETGLDLTQHSEVGYSLDRV